MTTHEEMEGVLDTDEQVLSVIDVYVEFTLKSIVYHDTSLNAYLVIFTIPVCLIGDWYAVPSVWVVMSKSLSYTSDDPLGKDVWL